MTASAKTTKNGTPLSGVANPRVNRAEPLSFIAVRQLTSSAAPQKISTKPTNTMNSHTAWNASSVMGGRMARTLSRRS